MISIRASLLAAAALLWPSTAWAQNGSTEETHDGADASSTNTGEGSEIVVVGKLTDRAIDREEIELTQANDLGALFRRAPSVSVGAAIGIAAKIYVRGIEDAQLNISIKSARDRAFFARSFDVGDTPSAQTA